MLLSSGATRRAAEDIRAEVSGLESLLVELTAPSVWQGPDADRLGAEWTSHVTTELLAAAADLDGIDFEDVATAWQRFAGG